MTHHQAEILHSDNFQPINDNIVSSFVSIHSQETCLDAHNADIPGGK